MTSRMCIPMPVSQMILPVSSEHCLPLWGGFTETLAIVILLGPAYVPCARY